MSGKKQPKHEEPSTKSKKRGSFSFLLIQKFSHLSFFSFYLEDDDAPPQNVTPPLSLIKGRRSPESQRGLDSPRTTSCSSSIGLLDVRRAKGALPAEGQGNHSWGIQLFPPPPQLVCGSGIILIICQGHKGAVM